MAGKRTSLASLAGARVETVPGQNDPTLVRLPLAKVVPTPLNPRTDFGGPDALTELGESMRRRQLQPVVVVGRVSYLKLFPEHTDQVGDASYVIITGERRYRGARQVDLDAIGAIILEEIATSRADVLDAVLSENIDRKNFNPIEEALAVQAMVKECGTAAAAATKFGRTGGWVSQRLALLRLAPEVQVLVQSGQMPVRDARSLAGHPADEQMRAWRQLVHERQQNRDKPLEDKQPAGQDDMVPAWGPAPTGAAAVAPGGGAGQRLPAAPLTAPRQRTSEAPAAEQPAQGPAAPREQPEPPAREAALPVDTGAPVVPWPEPEWAVGDTSDAVALARSVVDRFVPEERKRIVSYLLAVAEAERRAVRESA